MWISRKRFVKAHQQQHQFVEIIFLKVEHLKTREKNLEEYVEIIEKLHRIKEREFKNKFLKRKENLKL